MNNLKQALVNTNQQIEPYLKELLSDSLSPETAEQAVYQCAIGGKRIRPFLVMTIGQLLGAKPEDLVYPATAIEILHNSTLLADDIIDHSVIRRGQPTCWKKYGQSFAECQVLNYGASMSLGLTKSKHHLALSKLYSQTLKVVVEGEIKDILFERSGRDDEPYMVANRYPDISKDDYFVMVSQKTASLIEACCRAGAIIAEASEAQTTQVADYGRNIGLAFQIQDDILDIFGDEQEFGKKIGKDIIEKKQGNLVILSALEELSSQDKQEILQALSGSQEITDNQVSSIIKIINTTTAQQKAQDLANQHITLAKQSLEDLPDNEFRQLLFALADFIIARQN